MNVVICWSGISGYMAACWKALSRVSGVNCSIVAHKAKLPFEKSMLSGLDIKIVDPEDESYECDITKFVIGQNPDVVVLGGWVNRVYNGLPFCKDLKKTSFFMAMDTPWRGDIRQYLARFKLSRLLGRIDGVFVSGERGSEYARHLGFSSEKICKGVYGLDYEMFTGALERRLSQKHWPCSFLYVGRYAQEKGLELLVEAYRLYNRANTSPWPLHCYGAGPLLETLKSEPGIQEHGFKQPAELPGVFSEHGVFVMPSKYEPWGVVLGEACASGMPVVCTDSVCSSIDMARDFYNGRVVSPGATEQLADALMWMHDNYSLLNEMGLRSQVYAAAYSAAMWATRWSSFLTNKRKNS